MSDGKKETVSITTFEKWPFTNTFRVKPKMGKFCLIYANIAPKWNTVIACEKALPFFFLLLLFFKKVLYSFIEVYLPVMQVCNLLKNVICAKPLFLHGLDVPLKMFINSLTVLTQQTLGSTDHVHWFQTQSMESYLVVGSGKARDPPVVSFYIKTVWIP